MLRTERTVKKTGLTTHESHYYLSSALPDQHTPDQWVNLIRGHWGGVESAITGAVMHSWERTAHAAVIPACWLIFDHSKCAAGRFGRKSSRRVSVRDAGAPPFQSRCLLGSSLPMKNLKTKDPGAYFLGDSVQFVIEDIAESFGKDKGEDKFFEFGSVFRAANGTGGVPNPRFQRLCSKFTHLR